MPQQQAASIENNFTGGLKTEFTGLNFPENAATDCDNIVLTTVGDVTRRLGFNYEDNYTSDSFSDAVGNNAMQTYLWKNAGGFGTTNILVQQFGDTLYFYNTSAVTESDALSDEKMSDTVDLASFLETGSSLTVDDVECQFAAGNGYLFVYHPSLSPLYCTYDGTNIVGNAIQINIRDFAGVLDGLAANDRPSSLTSPHSYNLQNQGWTTAPVWQSQVTTGNSAISGSITFSTASTTTGVSNGDKIRIAWYPGSGFQTQTYITVTGTTTNSITGTIYYYWDNLTSGQGWTTSPRPTAIKISAGYIDDWHTDIGNYPSNADIWWRFKNSSDAFDPAGTIGNVSLGIGRAPRGHFVTSAFNIDRNALTGLTDLTVQMTDYRPRTGAWFQGRVWYAGVDDTAPAGDTSDYYSWTGNIYFSQVVEDTSDFGECYQENDPTDEDLNSLLPTDGGVISIKDSGSIYKLFAIQNGLLVFAANGIWFITGSQGIGFTANDYTITKISEIRGLTSTAFVNVDGMPIFWNEEGIYTLAPAQQGLGLLVTSLTRDSIDSFYADIPVESKLYARGDYSHVDYLVQWIYRGTETSDISERYNFNKVLAYNVKLKAFYTYTLPDADIDNLRPYVNGINFIPDYGANHPSARFKYLSSVVDDGTQYFQFSEENNEDFLDWETYTTDGIDFTSFFVTGYKIRGQAQRRYQPGYVYIFSRADEPTSYKIQGVFDYATSGNSGRWSPVQVATNNNTNFGMLFKRHRLRGQGLVLQLKVSSVEGEPFDIMGWSIYETINAGV